MNKRWLILCKSTLGLFIAGISLGMTDVLADDICKNGAMVPDEYCHFLSIMALRTLGDWISELVTH